MQRVRPALTIITDLLPEDYTFIKSKSKNVLSAISNIYYENNELDSIRLKIFNEIDSTSYDILYYKKTSRLHWGDISSIIITDVVKQMSYCKENNTEGAYIVISNKNKNTIHILNKENKYAQCYWERCFTLCIDLD